MPSTVAGTRPARSLDNVFITIGRDGFSAPGVGETLVIAIRLAKAKWTGSYNDRARQSLATASGGTDGLQARARPAGRGGQGRRGAARPGYAAYQRDHLVYAW